MTESNADIEISDAEQASLESESSHGEHLGADDALNVPPSSQDSTVLQKQAETARTATITDLKDRQLGDYRLLRRIGRGGMAEVYLAEQISLKRHVAVKVLREEMLAEDVHLKRFEQEAKAAGGLNHPHIVQVFSIGHEAGIHYIGQEYVQGMNLREFLNRNGPPDLALALRIMAQAASALQAASEAGIVHRDVKPENILLTRKNDVKITDFGLAQLSLPGENLNLTQVGMTMGTPLYMSPEQVNGRNIDQRSDIYSLGVTSYHMLCGVTPFRGETAMSVAIQHVNAEPQPLCELRPDLPPIVGRVVHKMMSKNPDDRYQDAESLLTDLNRIIDARKNDPGALAKMRLTEAPVSVIGPWWARSFRGWTTTRHVITFLVTATVVATASAGFGWWNRHADPFETPAGIEEETVPIKKTAFRQYYRAIQIDDEASWLAVIEHFTEPKDRTIRLRSKEALASLYLRTDRYDDAEKIYRSFIIEDDKDETLKATGYAGLAVLAWRAGKHIESQKFIIDDLRPLLAKGRKINAQLGRHVQEAFRRNQQVKDARSKKTLEEIFGPRNGSRRREIAPSS